MLKFIHRLIYDRCLALCFFSLMCFVITASATETQMFDNDENSRNIIEMYVKPDSIEEYRSRRSDLTARFSYFFEQMLPTLYQSEADGAKYKALFSDRTIDISSFAVGLQWNTGLGAFYSDAFYGKGLVTAKTASGSVTALNVDKYGLNFGILLDRIFDDPYVSPFIGGQIYYLSWNETDTSPSINISGTTSYTTAFCGGLSVHLNKIDTDSSVFAFMNYGLRNAFLDLMAIQYMSSNSKNDPDFKTDINYGVNVRLEF